MTSQNELGQEKRFVGSILPWVAALAVLVVYLLTFNSWVSLNNITGVARSSGWVLGQELFNPLWFLVTYPFRWLPAGVVPLAYNLFSLICGVLTLVLLARSVSLLPHDRTERQREREPDRLSLLSTPTAWMPPLLAVLVCGLQYVFWEGATSGSSDLFEILLFAYAIRCLLEYRVRRRDSWLYRAALVWGLSMSNGWLMFCLFPAFLISIIWIKGLSFFNLRFLFRLFLFGAAGLLLYLLMPLIFVSTADTVGSFWQALKVNISTQKQFFTIIYRQLPSNIQLLLAMSSFLPVLVIGIRWASNFGDPSKMGSELASWIFHLAHAALLGVCLWVAFDPVFSPRHISQSIPAFRDYFTSLVPALYYLGALSIGYLSGYFLLVFKPVPDHMGRTIPWHEWMYKGAQAIIGLVLIVVPVGLFYRNAPAIRVTNGPALKEYASLMVEFMPPHAVILGDTEDPRVNRRLFLVQSLLAGRNQLTNNIYLDTMMLRVPAYHGVKQKRHPGDFPVIVDPKSTESVDDVTLTNLLATLSTKRPLWYLHPSFGGFFEQYYQRPHGVGYALITYATNSFSPPPLTAAEIAENEKFWEARQDRIKQLIAFVGPPPPGTPLNFRGKLLKSLHLPVEPNPTAAILGRFYSLALNCWGVQEQRMGRLKEAEHYFQDAVSLYADNVTAKNNLDFNREMQSGKAPSLRPNEELDEMLAAYQDKKQLMLMRANGPYDDPSHCYVQGVYLTLNGLSHAGIQDLERAHALVPENLRVRLWLARVYITCHLADKALDLLANVHPTSEQLARDVVGKYEILASQASAYYTSERAEKAEELMENAVQKDPTDQGLLAVVLQLSAAFKRYTNAMVALDRHLQTYPDDVAALLTKGTLQVQLGQYQDSLPTFTRILSLQTNNYTAQLYRARSYINCEKLDDAQKDYEIVQKQFPNSIDVNSGLGEIAWLKKDTNNAIRYFELCLANAVPGSEQARFASERLRCLKPEAP